MRRRTRRALERAKRRVLRRIRKPRATCVFHPAYRVPGLHHLDPDRGQKIIAYLLSEGLVAKQQIHAGRRATVSQLAEAHSHTYLASLDHASTLERVFGEKLDLELAQKVVAQQRWMTGGTIAATRRALTGAGRDAVSVNLGGGLHHAYSDRAEGFCLFNDVAVAIRLARRNGFSGRVLVLDLDLHQGNGTRAIFANDPTVFTVSVHANEWDDRPAVASRDFALGPAVGDHNYLTALQDVIPNAMHWARPSLVFYVAGVDVAFDDALGSWRVSADGILARDRLVLEASKNARLVWLLAGGYGPDAWRHTARSIGFAAGGITSAIPSQLDQSLRRYRSIARRLTQTELTTNVGTGFDISPDDLMADLGTNPEPSRFLGYYTRFGLEVAFERYGVFEALRKHGYGPLRTTWDLGHPSGQQVRIETADPEAERLIELVVQDQCLPGGFETIRIEWLLLQNPRARPTDQRPLLPGQQHPGLGLLDKMIGLLLMACERLGRDGLSFSPAQYHVAAIARAHASFLDPAYEGRFRSVAALLEGESLARASHAVANGEVRDAVTGEPFAWQGKTMAVPASKRLQRHFETADYEAAVRRATRRFTRKPAERT